MSKETWIIQDWAGNHLFQDKEFDDFESGEDFLSEYLGDSWETDRQEYYVIRIK